MDEATANAVAASISANGYQAVLEPVKDSAGVVTGWIVRAASPSVDVPINKAKQLQDAHPGIVGKVRSVFYQ